MMWKRLTKRDRTTFVNSDNRSGTHNSKRQFARPVWWMRYFLVTFIPSLWPDTLELQQSCKIRSKLKISLVFVCGSPVLVTFTSVLFICNIYNTIQSNTRFPNFPSTCSAFPWSDLSKNYFTRLHFYQIKYNFKTINCELIQCFENFWLRRYKTHVACRRYVTIYLLLDYMLFVLSKYLNLLCGCIVAIIEQLNDIK